MLTATAVKNAKPKDKPYKLADGKGLYLLITEAGKYWRFDYRSAGKRRTLALGIDPDVSLAQARDRRDGARSLLAAGADPGNAKRAAKAARGNTESFEAIAREWHLKRLPTLAASTAENMIHRLEQDMFPWLGSRPIQEIKAPELLACLRRIEARGALEIAHRMQRASGAIFRYAIATGRAERDPAADLRGALAPIKVTHHPAIIEPKAAGELLRAIDGYSGTFVVRCAMKLAPYVFVRPGELRRAEWSDFDLDIPQWRMRPANTKMREPHVVPLPAQAVAILRELHPLTGSGRYVFPGERSDTRPMSENTINAALRRLSYAKDVMCGHGFRAMARTILDEVLGFPVEVIEQQLAHAVQDANGRAYNRTKYLQQRKAMMQAWADYLDVLREQRNVVAGAFGRAA